MLSNKTTHQKAILALAWVSFFWGTTWLASHEGVKYMPALQLSAIRQGLGGLLYLIYFVATKHPWPKGKQWVSIFVLSALNFFLTNGLSTWGVKYISSGLAAIISAIFPLWLVFIVMFQGEKVPTKALLGLILGFGGICIIFYDHLKDFLNADFRFGIILTIISTFTWAFGTLYTKKHAVNFNPYFSLGLQMLISSIALFAVTYSTNNVIPFSKIPAYSWWSILYLVVVGSVLTFIAYIYCLQHLPTSVSSLYAYFNPMVAVLVGALVFNEKLDIFVGLGGIVTLSGIYLVNNSMRKKAVA